jgi:hypothetical protein
VRGGQEALFTLHRSALCERIRRNEEKPLFSATVKVMSREDRQWHICLDDVDRQDFIITLGHNRVAVGGSDGRTPTAAPGDQSNLGL